MHTVHADLVTDLKKVAYKWHSLGIQLQVENLDNIKDGFSAQTCLHGVVHEWLNNTTSQDTKSDLQKALKNIGYKRLADDLTLPKGLLLVGLRY